LRTGKTIDPIPLFLYAVIYMETALKEAQIPEIRETTEDKKLSDGDLKHKYFIFAGTGLSVILRWLY